MKNKTVEDVLQSVSNEMGHHDAPDWSLDGYFDMEPDLDNLSQPDTRILDSPPPVFSEDSGANSPINVLDSSDGMYNYNTLLK